MHSPFRSEILVELHVPDFQAAYDFYKVLDFQLLWLEDTYMILKFSNQVLCFYGGNSSVDSHSYFSKFPQDSKKGFGVEIILFREDVEKFYQRVCDKINIVAPLQTRPWGRADFRVEDPFGYYLRISESYDTVMWAEKIEQTKAIITKNGFKK